MTDAANQVPFGCGQHMTAEAIAAELVHNFSCATNSNLGTSCGNSKLEKFPVIRRRVPARVVFDHHFARNQGNYGARWIFSTCFRICNGEGSDAATKPFNRIDRVLRYWPSPHSRHRWGANCLR